MSNRQSSCSMLSLLLFARLLGILSVFVLTTTAGAADISARFLADYGNVSVMEVTGNFDEFTPDGAANAAPRQAVAKEFFRSHRDDYDFVVIFTNFDYTMKARTAAFFTGVRNDVLGIGLRLFDNSALYGSNGMLQGTIDMGNLHTLATDPVNAQFDFTIDTLMHEMLHRWGAHVKFCDWNGVESSALLGEDKAHWSFLLDSGGSTLYGNKWRNNNDGSFTSTAARHYYSPLDLYLMGMIGSSKVPPMLLIENSSVDPARLPELGASINGTPRTVTIGDIIAAEGERIPSSTDSRKAFRTAFVYAVTPGSFNPDDLPGLENVRNAYLTRFSILTDGKGLLQVTPAPRDELPANPGVPPPSTTLRTLPPSLNDGLSWLVKHQQADGSWSDLHLTGERDTAESATTLRLFPAMRDQMLAGLGWLESNSSSMTDYLARRIEAVIAVGGDTSTALQQLLARRNSDGGWGVGRNFTSSPTDTALALKALAAAGFSERGVIGPAIAYLTSCQNSDGGWSGDNGASLIQPTATVLAAYSAYRKGFDLEAGLARALDFLTSKQNQDGGFGNSPSTVYDSSLALMALQAVNGSQASIVKGTSYLQGKQAEDGSWNASTFQTALAIRAIWQATIESDLAVQTEDISIIPAKLTSLPTGAVLSATIRNLGRSDVSGVRVVLYEGGMEPEKELAEQIIAVPGLSAVTAAFPISVSSARGHVYYVVADPDNQLKEPNKDNNHAAKTLLPEISYDFQIQAADISASPSPATISQDVKIVFKVSNRGTSDAYNVPVRLFIDQPGAPFEIATLTLDIPAGGTTTREVHWRAGLAGTDLPLSVQIDPSNTFIETSTENNRASTALTVNSSTLPNLSVSYKDMVISPAIVREGGNASISVLVKNDGYSIAENVTVKVVKGSPGSTGTLLGSGLIPAIAAGQSMRTVIEWNGIVEYGERIISVQVEPDNGIQEITLDDNFTFTTLDILSLPDLAVSANAIVVTPAAPTSADRVALAVTVQNSGEQEARDVTVQLQEAGNIIGTSVIPLVNGNSQATGMIDYVHSGQTGSHHIVAAIDPDKSITERSRENNSAVKIFSIQDANLWLSESYISPDGNGVKDSSDFSFRLAAPAKVTIQVIDKQGRAVRTFSGGELDATTGTSISWDGTNDAGSVVADGSYQISVLDTRTVLASLPIEVDTNRSPLTDAIGTTYLVPANLTCQIPSGSFSNWSWLPHDSGIVFDNFYEQAGFPPGSYQMSPMGGDIWKITPDNWSDASFNYSKSSNSVLSPDGTHIVFTIQRINRNNLEKTESLWIQGINGQGLSRLVDDVPGYFFDMNWSPDGSILSYQQTSPDYWYSALYTIRPDTAEQRQLYKGYARQSRWSPDNAVLAFETDVDCTSAPCAQIAPTLMIAGPTGDNREIYVAPNESFDLHWLAEGKLLLELATWPRQLLLVDARESMPTKVLATMAEDFSINRQYEISPDGRRIAYLVTDGILPAAVHQTVWLAGVDGIGTSIGDSSLALLTHCEGACLNTPNLLWSQNSNRLAYIATHYRDSDNKIEEHLVVFEAETGKSASTVVAQHNAATSGYFDDPAMETPRTIQRLVTWLDDGPNLLLDTTEGYFAFNTADGARSSTLPIPANDFWNSQQPGLSSGQRYLVYQLPPGPNTACTDQSGWGTWSLGSLLNLTADLRIVKNKSSIKLKGIAADKNFAGYRLEYADVHTPENWNLIMPPADIPVLDGLFTEWVPLTEGEFMVRLTVWDKAGNTVTDRKRLTWGNAATIGNIFKTREYISPNADDVQDTVELHYQLQGQLHLEFTVYNSENVPVRSYFKEHIEPGSYFISWDGRDSFGQVVPDGKYRINVLHYDFFVTVDTAHPETRISIIQETMQDPETKLYFILVRPTIEASDNNLKQWWLETGRGENPPYWSAIRAGTTNIEQGNTSLQHAVMPSYRDQEIGRLKGVRFRLSANDAAGNRSGKSSNFIETIRITGLDAYNTIGQSTISSSALQNAPIHTISGFETIATATASRTIQYRIDNTWLEAKTHPVDVNADGSFSYEWDTSSLPVNRLEAIRIKVVNVAGGVQFSSELGIIQPDSFYIDDTACRIRIVYDMPVPVSTISLQFSSDGEKSWIEGKQQVVASGTVFDHNFGSLAEILNELQLPANATYRLRAIARTINGETLYTKSEAPHNCTPGKPKINISYAAATSCNSLAPGTATVTVGANIPLPEIKSLRLYMQTPSGEKQLADFGATESGTAVVDTNLLPDGNYLVTAELVRSSAGTGTSAKTTAILLVNRLLPQAQLTYPASTSTSICPDADHYLAIEGVADSSIGLDRYKLYYAIGSDAGEWIDTKTIGTTGARGTLGKWNVRDVNGGNYSLQLRTFDRAGNLGCGSASFYLNGPTKVETVVLDKKVISSNHGETAAATYRVNGPAQVSVQAFAATNSSGVLSLSSPAIRTIMDGNWTQGRIENTEWDGRNDSGLPPPDGLYGLTVTAVNACGSTDRKWAQIEIDNTAPQTAISYPQLGDPLPNGNIIEIMGTVQDPHFKIYTLEVGEGDAPVTWRTLATSDKPIANGVIAQWNTFELKNRWTLRLRSEDTVGNKNSATSTIDLGSRKGLIKSLSVTPQIFSPNNDQKLDATTFMYEVTDACTVKLDLLDTNDLVVRSFTASTAAAVKESIVWDGRHSNGSPAPDGLYKMRFMASLISAPHINQTEVLTLAIDSSMPTIAIQEPQENAFINKTELPVIGTITDQNLAVYTVSTATSAGATVLDSGKQTRAAYLFGTLGNLAEDNYTIIAEANDLGENSAKLVRRFTIDRTPPRVILESPKYGEFYGGSRNLLEIGGRIIEKNLENYSLRYGAGESPHEWREMVGGASVPTVPRFYSWKVGKDDGITDGSYSISLLARDKAGLEGEARIRVIVDNTPPEVVISRPKDGDVITRPSDIKGTLNDANLDHGQLELAEGSCSTTSKWTVIKTINASVRDSMLDSWKVLPKDGSYCLRLSATDKSGNNAEIQIGFRIDMRPPAPPLLSGTTESKVRNKLHWTRSADPDIAGYNLYRNGQKLNTAMIAESDYSDGDLKEGSYSYTVKAVDLAGNESAASNSLTLTIDLSGPLVRISTPRNETRVSSLVDIKGSAYSQDDFKEYRVLIGQGNNPTVWTVIRRSPLPISFGTLAQWDSIACQDGAQFTIRLEGEDLSGNLSSEQTTVTIDNTAPQSPVLLGATSAGSDINLVWKSNTENDLAGYLLYRNEQLANGSQKPYLLGGTSYSDMSLPDGTYRYYLLAMDLAGNSSGQSNALDVTIDTHPPQMVISEPLNNLRFEERLMVRAESPDKDIATVQFRYKRPQDPGWSNLGAPAVKAPYIAYLDPKAIGLVYGDYQLQALATDKGGKTDLDPPAVNLTYTDLTAPAPPVNPAGRVNGADVALSWDANREADLNGYHVYRWNNGVRTKLYGSAVTTASYLDRGVPDGNYSYELTAVDTYGNESAPSHQTSARIYAPLIKQPFTPVAVNTTRLEGENAIEQGHVEIVVESAAGTSIGSKVAVDGNGRFQAEAIPLAFGKNRLYARSIENNGNLSRDSNALIVYHQQAPAAPTKLNSIVNGYDVDLSWTSNLEEELAGYAVYRDGTRQDSPVQAEGGTASATSSFSLNSDPQQALDGNLQTGWLSVYGNGLFEPAWWQADFPASILVNQLNIEWLDTSVAGKDFELQAWSGDAWITLAQISGNTLIRNSLPIHPAYRTDRIRLNVTASNDDSPGRQVGIAEVTVFRENPLIFPNYRDMSAKDGKYRYQVSAINQFGFESPLSEAVEVVVGDVTPPAAPSSLSALPAGTDIALDWSGGPCSDADLAGYIIYREASSGWQRLSEALQVGTSYLDLGLSNGTYRYRITAVDLAGNESLPSPETTASIAITPPAQPAALQVAAVPEGKALFITWQAGGTEVNRFKLYRSSVEMGPYDLITPEPIAGLSYRDTGLVNGRRYFYVVIAIDAPGNESLRSPVVSGIPADSTSPYAPILFYPARPGGAVHHMTTNAIVIGSGEPASTVELFNNDSMIASVPTLAEDKLKIMAFDQPIFQAAASPNGASVAYIDDSNYNIWLMDSTTGESRLLIRTEGDTLSWAPDGLRFAYTYWDTAVQSLRIGLYDSATRAVTALTSDLASYEDSPCWSPDGSSLLFVSTRTGNQDLWLMDMISHDITQLTSGGDVYRAWFSPNGDRIAFIRAGNLYLMDLADRTPTRVGENLVDSSLSWSPDGALIAFSSYHTDTGGSSLHIVRASTVKEIRVIDSLATIQYSVWSPDSTAIIYSSYDDASGTTSLQTVNHTGDIRLVQDRLEGLAHLGQGWAGSIVYANATTLFTRTLAGTFTHSLKLNIGENMFTAIARDPSGNTSAPSEPISVIMEADTLPDLVVAAGDITIFPPCPKPGEDVLVTARVHNRSGNAIENVRVDIYLWDGSSELHTLVSENINQIGSNSDGSASVRFTVGAAGGSFTIIAVADPVETIDELQEDNNFGIREFAVSTQGGVQLTVALNTRQPSAHQQLLSTITLLNSDQSTSGFLYVAVEDSTGNIVQQLTGEPLDMPYGLNTVLSFSWNTGSTYAGNYRLHAVVTDGITVLSEDSKDFTILPEIKVSAALVTDRQQYIPGQAVAITTNFTNSAANYIIPRLEVLVRILDARNTELFSGWQTSANVLPGMSGSLDFGWNAGLNSPGTYMAQVEYHDGDYVVGSAATSFSIVTSVAVSGCVKTEQNIVPSGEMISTIYTIGNSGNTNATGYATISLVDPDTQRIISTSEQPASIPAAGTYAGSIRFTSTMLALKPYLITLQFSFQTQSVLLGSTSIIVRDSSPPVLSVNSPRQGEHVSGDVNFSVTASDNASGVARVDYSRNGGTWLSLPSIDPATGRYGFSWSPRAGDSGHHTVSFRATDWAGNTSASFTVPFTVLAADTSPPLLVVSTLANGSSTRNPVLNVTGTVVDASGVESLIINGIDATLNQDGEFSLALMLQPGPNEVSVTATDRAGNRNHDSRTINLDMLAPQLTITAPDDNAKTAVALMHVSGSVDESATIIVKLDDVEQLFTLAGATFDSMLNLAPGINTIEVIATDPAGNSNSQKRTVVFDNLKPSLAITSPGQDIRTNQPGLLLKGTVSDPYSRAMITIAMNGQNHTPEVISGQFEQQLTFTEEDDYAIVVTALDEVGNSSSIQRNVIYDITPPVLTINPVQNPTTASSLLLSGTREAGLEISVSCPAITIGGIIYPTETTWQVHLSGMPPGEHVITAQSSDDAQNVSKVSLRLVVLEAPPDIVLVPSRNTLWPPRFKKVPITINGIVNVPQSDIQSLNITLSDEYGRFNRSNLKIGDTVYVKALRKRKDNDGRKYTFKALLTRKDGSETAATAVVTVPRKPHMKTDQTSADNSSVAITSQECDGLDDDGM